MAHKFVGLPRTGEGKRIKTVLYESDLETKYREVFWGDWLAIADADPGENIPAGWLKVNWGPTSDNPKTVFIREEHTTDTRPLEIVFIDVGQGDGAVLITPEKDDGEAIIVIDAGENEKMHEFLQKRFKPYNSDVQFHAAIITHSDSDHYAGFE